MKRQICIDTLQWFIGIYIAIRGILVLMLPHTLNTHVFVPIQPHLPWMGAWHVIGGAVMIVAVTLVPRRPIILLAHFVTGCALLQAAFGHLLAGTWTALVDFGILGLGTVIAPFLQNRQRLNSKRGIDLFALLMGIRLVLDGVIVLAPFNPQFNAHLYDPVRSYLPLYGIAYLTSGLALLAAYFYTRTPKRLFLGAHLLAGGVLWSWTVGLRFPTWNSVLFYGGLGTLLALLPWLGSYLRRLDPGSLQTQLVVTLVSIVTLPLLLAVTLVTLPQEQATINQALTLQQTLANALSQNIASYVNLHHAVVNALAKHPSLTTMSPAEQQNLLQRINQAYPDIVTFATYDAAGNAIARSDNLPLSPPVSEFEWYKTVRQLGQPALDIRIGRIIQKPIFVFAAPVYDSQQKFVGAVAGVIESSRMAKQLIKMGESANIKAYLVNNRGRVIAHPDANLVRSFADYSQIPPVAALLKQDTAIGGLQYWDKSQWQLAGYALVPDIGWAVVAERPASKVLAALHHRRNRDFQTLLVVTVTALTIGLLVARTLSNSLKTLAYATNQLTTGNTKAPLPESRITEVKFLSSAFAAMREHLAKRTAERDQVEQEREQLLQRERAAREEAETANRIKDEFLTVLSHELRTPLNPILGWSRLLQTHKFDDAKTTTALATIERNAKLQTQLIDDLLDVAKILRGKLSLNIQSVNLSFVIKAAIDTVRTAAVAKSITLHPVLPNIGQVSGDTVRLQQIIWNLLSNAIKFSPNGGQVDIWLKRVGDQAEITVKDTGKGISPDFLPYIFESFRQEDASTTRKFGGLGLGLAIVKHLVEAHSGTITADSPGVEMGATFTVRLPLVNIEPESQHSEATLDREPDLSGIRVLIVDDEPDARELLAVMLTQYGAAVMTVTCAAQVLAIIESFKPNLLISDIGMSDVDGYSLIQQIRALSPERGGQIPAIALTAYAGEIDYQQAMTAGFQRHLPKPVDSEMLVKAIADLSCLG